MVVEAVKPPRLGGTWAAALCFVFSLQLRFSASFTNLRIRQSQRDTFCLQRASEMLMLL